MKADYASSEENQENDPYEGFDVPELERSLRKPRTFFSIFLSGMTTLLTLSAMIPLFSVVYMLFMRGGRSLSAACFTQLPPAAFEEGGGFGNAIVGTLLMVLIAGLISVPIGTLAAIFLAEISPESRLSQAVRFAAKTLTGFPSILAGVFVYGALVVGLRGIRSCVPR